MAMTKNVGKWTTQQISSLIDAYKEETCLYATNQPNYHNKHLRAEALVRVCQTVTRLRPMTTPKECLNKFHNLRNQFNIEHAKVRASHKSGTGTDDIYKPSLWYYPNLLFLETYVTPRRSINSLDKMDRNLAKQQEAASFINENNTQRNQTGEDSHSMNMLFSQENNAFDNFDSQNLDSQFDMQDNLPTSPSYHLKELNDSLDPSPSTSRNQNSSLVIISPSASNPSPLTSLVSASPSTLPSCRRASLSTSTGSSTASPSTSNCDVQKTTYTPGSISPSKSTTTSSGISSISQPRSKRKKASIDSSDADYSIAIHELAESMKQPITINTVPNTAHTSSTTSFDPVNPFVEFIGSLFRSFHDEEFKLQVMSDVSQMVINAKSADLQRSKKS